MTKPRFGPSAPGAPTGVERTVLRIGACRGCHRLPVTAGGLADRSVRGVMRCKAMVWLQR